MIPSAVPILAIDSGPTIPVKPTAELTAIELPRRLLISPNHFARFVHESNPFSSKEGWTELWHTRLGIQTDAGVTESDHPPTVHRRVASHLASRLVFAAHLPIR